MNFLAPLFLLGALAVALPVVFHLIRRTSRDKVPFSSLMFLLPTPPRVTRRSRLENIWLLILRCLVVCLLALGFSRPFFSTPLAPDPESGLGKRIVLLLDTSASMRRENLWPEARARANEVLRKVSPSDQVALFTFDRQVRTLVSFEQWAALPPGERAAAVARRLEESNPGWADTHLGNALIAAAESFQQMSQPDRHTGPKQIVLVSDLQEGSRLDGLQGYEWPRDIELAVEPLKAKRPTNAGLQLIADRDAMDKSSAEDRPRVRVSNSANARTEQFQIGWARAGEKGPANAGGVALLDAYVPPGQSRVVSAPQAPTGLVEERLVLTGDEEDFDNSVYLVPTKPQQIDLLFLGGDSDTDPNQPLYYLKRAFQQTRRQSVRVNARLADIPLESADMDSAKLMIVAQALAEGRIPPVKKFLSDGKTVLLVMKDPSVAQTLARFLDKNTLQSEEAPGPGYAMLGQIDFEHPLFAPFADPRYSDFTKIHFWKHRRLDANELGNARVVARFDNGDPALLQISIGKGTLLVLTSGWHPADSQLALSSKFVPLLYSILEQSGAVKAQTSQYVVGDAVSLGSPGNEPLLKVRRPDGVEVTLTNQALFTQTELPGIYAVPALQPQVRFAVNLAPEESRTAPLAVEELVRLGLPLKSQAASSTKEVEKKRRQLQAAELEQRQKLWRWLIVAALVALMLETWLAGRLTRNAVVAAATRAAA